MLLQDATQVTKDLLAHLQDPEFNDIKIVALDGEVPANKIILSMRSEYFCSMFSANNNFVESSSSSAKLPYSKIVVEKALIYLYSGEMDCADMALRSLMDILELLNLMNLPSKYSVVEAFTLKNITNGKYPLSDCLKSLDDCSKMGLQSVGANLLTHLDENLIKICKMTEVGKLSYAMAKRLIKEKEGAEHKSILRLKTLLTWLEVTSQKLNKERIDKTLKKLDLGLEHFTHRELTSSDVRKSGLYDIDKIMERMDQLFETQEETLEEKENEIDEMQDLLVKSDK